MTDILPIESDRLIIRSFRESDAVAFHGWRNDADVARYTLWDYPYDMERARAYCAKMAAATPFEEGQSYRLIIEEKATGEPVGDIGIGNGTTLEGAGNVRVSYGLGSNAQGRGYMTEALRALLPALVEPLGVHTFSADIDARNPASGRVLERLGFRRGQFFEKRTFVKGEWCDEIDYDLPVEELLKGNKD